MNTLSGITAHKDSARSVEMFTFYLLFTADLHLRQETKHSLLKQIIKKKIMDKQNQRLKLDNSVMKLPIPFGVQTQWKILSLSEYVQSVNTNLDYFNSIYNTKCKQNIIFCIIQALLNN